MSKRNFAFLFAVLTFVVGVAIARFSLPDFRKTLPPEKKELQLSNYRLSGPFQHENLTIFLVHGPDQPNSRTFTPLQEAMERKIVIVHETSDVNELAIENVSASEEVFVQAGDIVKGGRQDRVLAVDLIVPAKSGQIPIAAFCVEHSRWSQRGIESPNQFSMSDGMIANLPLKFAARSEASQQQVWDEVDKSQVKLSAGVAADVHSDLSKSSLQLSLENEELQKVFKPYTDKLSPIVNDSPDVIGFVFAINNQLSSADVYASNGMFKRFWPRLLKSAAIEAVSERFVKDTAAPVSIAAAGEFLVSSEKGEETLNAVTPRTHMIKRDAEKSVFFETRDMDHGAAWIHRSYLSRG